MPNVVACTIVAHNYLPLARVVARSFLDQHPDARFVVGVVDKPVEARALQGECFEVLPITDIDFGDVGFVHMATYYDVTEFATAVKPYLLRQLVDSADCVLYLDPDIFVYETLEPLINATIEAGWSLTPHCLKPIERNGSGPTEAEIMAAGIYNLGYIGVTKSAKPMLNWWAERLRFDSIIDTAHQLFTDQRWIDLAVPIFRPHIEQSPSYNVAYWNVDQRNFWCDGNKPMVGDEPVRFFHFSGYEPKAPFWLSKYQPLNARTLMSDNPQLAELCVAYGDAMKAAGRGAGPVATYGWNEAFAGFKLDGFARRSFRDECMLAVKNKKPMPPSPFAKSGAKKYYEWLQQVPTDSPRRLPRFLDMVWLSRHDLQIAFPQVSGGHVDEYLHWARTSGVAECPSLQVFPQDHKVEKVIADSAVDEIVPPVVRRHDGIDVVAYFNAELGVGEAGRLATSALSAAELPTGTIAYHATTSRQDHDYEAGNVAQFDTVLVATNADQLPHVRHDLREQFAGHKYIIGQWFWEVDIFPAFLHNSFALVNEVWAATEHIRASVAAVAPANVAVKLMHLPLVTPTVKPGVTKADFGLEDRFTFLFTFDFLSVLERKNPMGVIDAFTRAFAPNEGPVLVLKTINGEQTLRDLEEVRWACRNRTDIVLIDEYYETAMTGALTQACDCYVSLHRAEGLGLTMAEAMSLGKPVIATGYSGNLDFMTDSTAYLVPWTSVKIGTKAAPYPAEGTWAQPDLDVAAEMMRDVYENQSKAAAVGAAAKADLAERFSPEATGKKMKQRLQQIWEK